MMTTTFAYRDPLEGARLRYAELHARRTREQAALDDADRALGRRTARLAAGLTGVAGILAITAAFLRTAVAQRPVDGEPTTILLGVWPTMTVAYLLGRVDLWRRLGTRTEPARIKRDLHTEIAHMEQPLPIEAVRARATRLERASVSLPLVVAALLGPLTLHALVYVVLGGNSRARFDGWMLLSLAIVGHAHVALAWMGHRYATRMRDADSVDVRHGWANEAWRVYGRTLLVAAIPGAILLFIPPILTAVTGAFIILPAFYAMARQVVTERALLGGEPVPF